MSKSSDRHVKIEALKSQNVIKVLKDGPGLRYDLNTWVEARDRTKKRVLLGGLGGMGVGKMWFDETEDHRDYTGYDDAPEQEAPPHGQPW
jgi:hypothetical protein